MSIIDTLKSWVRGDATPPSLPRLRPLSDAVLGSSGGCGTEAPSLLPLYDVPPPQPQENYGHFECADSPWLVTPLPDSHWISAYCADDAGNPRFFSVNLQNPSAESRILDLTFPAGITMSGKIETLGDQRWLSVTDAGPIIIDPESGATSLTPFEPLDMSGFHYVNALGETVTSAMPAMTVVPGDRWAWDPVGRDLYIAASSFETRGEEEIDNPGILLHYRFDEQETLQLIDYAPAEVATCRQLILVGDHQSRILITCGLSADPNWHVDLFDRATLEPLDHQHYPRDSTPFLRRLVASADGSAAIAIGGDNCIYSLDPSLRTPLIRGQQCFYELIDQNGEVLVGSSPSEAGLAPFQPRTAMFDSHNRLVMLDDGWGLIYTVKANNQGTYKTVVAVDAIADPSCGDYQTPDGVALSICTETTTEIAPSGEVYEVTAPLSNKVGDLTLQNDVLIGSLRHSLATIALKTP